MRKTIEVLGILKIGVNYMTGVIYLFILFFGKRRQARAWNAICRYQKQYDNMMTEC